MSYFKFTHPKDRRLGLFPSLRVATLYTYLSETVMMINRQSIGLKGQFILAQGNPPAGGGALGWEMGIKIVRATMFIKEKILFRTSEMTLCFPKMMSDNSVRKELFALFIESTRTVFLLHPLPSAAPGFTGSRTGLNYIGLSGRKNRHAVTCV